MTPRNRVRKTKKKDRRRERGRSERKRSGDRSESKERVKERKRRRRRASESSGRIHDSSSDKEAIFKAKKKVNTGDHSKEKDRGPFGGGASVAFSEETSTHVIPESACEGFFVKKQPL